MRSEEITFFFALWGKLAGAPRFERRTSVLETDVLPIKTKRLKVWRLWRDLNAGPRVSETCAFDPSELQSQKIGVDDGNRTRSIRFGRPALSLLSFAHILKWDRGTYGGFDKFYIFLVHWERFELSERQLRSSFTDCLPLPTGNQCNLFLDFKFQISNYCVK